MAGFKKFDPDGWQPDRAANAAKVAKVETAEGSALATLATLAGVHAAGVRTLDAGKPPSGCNGAAWACAVRDAKALLADGWAETALSLGWSALDLFGAVPDPAGDPYGDGLAVWLSGRKVLALDEMCAVSSDAHGTRFYFHRPRGAGAVLMWTLGRGR
jgi:hypothetical protein